MAGLRRPSGAFGQLEYLTPPLVGEVAVSFGICAEPSTVKAGGNACPCRFRCAGCDHFRTDISYLPDLTAYLPS